MLNMKKVKPELISDVVMYLFFENIQKVEFFIILRDIALPTKVYKIL